MYRKSKRLLKKRDKTYDKQVKAMGEGNKKKSDRLFEKGQRTQRKIEKAYKKTIAKDSPNKKTIAKDKDPKFKSNRKSQADFVPMFEGADISRAQFNKMSKSEQKKYVKTQTD
jgi:hypothetical protein